MREARRRLNKWYNISPTLDSIQPFGYGSLHLRATSRKYKLSHVELGVSWPGSAHNHPNGSFTGGAPWRQERYLELEENEHTDSNVAGKVVRELVLVKGRGSLAQ